MYCEKCGKNISNGDKFCGICGTVISKEYQTEKIYPRSYISKIIFVKSKRRLYFGCLLVAVACIIFISQSNYISNLISGPRPMDDQTLENELVSGNIKDINVSLSLSAGSVYNSGYTHITQTVDQTTNKVESETTNSAYYLTIIGKHILVIEGIPGQLPSGNFTGVVIPLPADLQSGLASDFNSDPDLKELSGSILSYAISNEGMRGLDDFWVFLFALGLLCWGAFIVIKRGLDIEDKKHYIYKIISSAGYQNIDDFSDDFMKSEQAGVVKIGGYKLNNKFLSHKSFFFFDVYPLSQMYWSYKKITKRSVNFIPAGKDFGVVMHFRPNKVVTIKEQEKNVEQHLMLLIKLCPNAKFGYTK
jgi:hypothetical protein